MKNLNLFFVLSLLCATSTVVADGGYFRTAAEKQQEVTKRVAARRAAEKEAKRKAERDAARAEVDEEEREKKAAAIALTASLLKWTWKGIKFPFGAIAHPQQTWQDLQEDEEDARKSGLAFVAVSATTAAFVGLVVLCYKNPELLERMNRQSASSNN